MFLFVIRVVASGLFVRSRVLSQFGLSLLTCLVGEDHRREFLLYPLESDKQCWHHEYLQECADEHAAHGCGADPSDLFAKLAALEPAS